MPIRRLAAALAVGIPLIGWLAWADLARQTLFVQDPTTRIWHAVAHLPPAACADAADTISTLRPRVSTRCD
jgi:hypothetical protein